MAGLTREEFIKKHGMTPEEKLAQNRQNANAPVQEMKDAQVTKGPRISQRRYGVTPPKPDNLPANSEVEFTSPKEDLYQEMRTTNANVYSGIYKNIANLLGIESDPEVEEAWKAVGRSSGDTARANEQLTKNVGSGIAQLPTSPVPLIDTLVQGTEAAVQTPFSDKGLLDNFGEQVYGQEGIAAMQEFLTKGVTDYMAKNPNATQDDVGKELARLQASPEMYKISTSYMSPGMRFGENMNEFTNDLVGLGKRPDQQTVVDDLEQMAGQTLVGVPSAVPKAIEARVMRVLGERAVQSLPYKVATRVAEAATPVTHPYTPTNLAVNAGVGAATTEIMRRMAGSPSMTKGNVADFAEPPMLPVDMLPEKSVGQPEAQYQGSENGHVGLNKEIDDGIALPYTLAGIATTVGAMFSFPALRRMIADDAFKSVERDGQEFTTDVEEQLANAGGKQGELVAPATNKQTIPGTDVPVITEGGPARADQSNRMQRTILPFSDVVDNAAPAKKVVQQFKSADDTESVGRVERAIAKGQTVNVREEESKAINFGIIKGIDDTLPLTELEALRSRMTPLEREMNTQYLYARQRIQDYHLSIAERQDEVSSLEKQLKAAKNRNDVRAYNATKAKLDEAQTKLTATLNDEKGTRSSFTEHSIEDMKQVVEAAKQMPKVIEFGKMVEKLSAAMINARYANGLIDYETATNLALRRELYFPLKERLYAEHSGLKRTALLMRDRIMGKGAEDGAFIPEIARDLSGEGVQVNLPMDPIAAIHGMITDVVRDITRNNARQEVVDTVLSLPDAYGKAIRAVEFDVGNGRKVTEISKKQFDAIKGDKMLGNDGKDYVRVMRNGKLTYYEFADKEITKALQYAPQMVVPLFNATRRLFQQTTTHLLAPWFSMKQGLFWDAFSAKTTSEWNRSLGLLDTLGRLMFKQSSAITALGNVLPDPTMFLSVAAAVPYQVALKSARAVGYKISKDLEHNYGMFSVMAKLPGGKIMLERVGQSMSKAFDNSVLNIMQRNMHTSFNTFEHIGALRDNYKVAAKGPISKTTRSILNAYVGMLEAVQNATKTAFFYENMMLLAQKHGGKMNIPDHEIEKLAHETTLLAGDMTKISGNKFVQGATSVIPYGNAVLQGTRHMMVKSIPKSVARMINSMGGNIVEEGASKFWPQLVSSVIMPKLAMLGVLASWKGAQEYWDNSVPDWQRNSGIPVPTSESVVQYYETGEWPEFSPDKLQLIPVSPEYQPHMVMVEAGLRAMGLIGASKRIVPDTLGDSLSDSFGMLTSFGTPPLIQLLGAANNTRIDIRKGLTGQGLFQPIMDDQGAGINNDMKTFNSRIPQTMYDMITALGSAASDVVLQSADVFDVAMQKDLGFSAAAKAAIDTFGYEVGRRFPSSPIPGTFEARVREYAMTPNSEYVYKVQSDIKRIQSQLSVESDKKHRQQAGENAGYDVPAKIQTPILRDLAHAVSGMVRKKGEFKTLADQYTGTRDLLQKLEATRYRMATSDYDKQRNDIVRVQQQIKARQARILSEREAEYQRSYNRFFMKRYGKPFSYKVLADAISMEVAGQ